jgi:two-component system, NarL family, response regulator DevR
MTPIRILVVDDHPIVRQGIRSLLSNYPEFHIIGEAETGQETLTYFRQTPPDVTLLDLSLPQESGIDVLRQIRQQQPDARVLILTSYDDQEYILEALRAGALGFVLKNVSDEMLVNAIQSVYKGQRAFSPQVTEQVIQQAIDSQAARPQEKIELDQEERQILRLLTEGASNEQIGNVMYMSKATVKRKLRHIFTCLDVQTRTQAAAEAVRRGLV